MALISVAFTLFLLTSTEAKRWNNTGQGSVIFEEALSLDYPEFSKTM